MTKRILRGFVVMSSVMALLAGVAVAGDYHTGINLICSDCHTMHASQSHGPNANGGGNFTPIGAGGPYEFLLRNDVNDLCLSCHDGQAFAPDVFESHGNGYIRQAGALNNTSSTGSYHPENGHTLGSGLVAPGGTWRNLNGLDCVDCHAPHGRVQGGTAGANGYRNLFSAPSGISISYSRGDVEVTNDLTRWVFEDASSGVNANHYGYDHITFNEPTATASQYANFCKDCHTNFHGAVGGTEIGGVAAAPPAPAGTFEAFKRHPASTVNIGEMGGGHSSLARFVGTSPVVANRNQVQVMSPTGVRAGSYVIGNTTLTPSCMSCHKGHGNQNAFGLIFMLGSGAITEQGDNGVDSRNLCRQCHSMGGTATTY
jgi:hypothetical protein